jgi:hypothetical protein
VGEDYRTSRDAQDKPRRDIRCYNCGEQGHVRIRCPKLKKDEKSVHGTPGRKGK